ncbi:MAG TPA: TIM-barrel domain-containing protein [Baekduia sp.]|nr:TIM-barrel domain-containing protein [Baekduia sp.]
MDAQLVLERGGVRAEIKTDPLRIDLRRDDRRLVRSMQFWVAECEVLDRFIHFTEGVVAKEELGTRERPVSVAILKRSRSSARLSLVLEGGRVAQLSLALRKSGSVDLSLRCRGSALRLNAEWDRRDGEHLAGLGARHHGAVDHAGRRIQLGADRRYTGPDCPPDMLGLGGIPQGDYAPVPWLQSSRGYAVWCRSDANGVRFDLDERVRVSARVEAGPLRLRLYTEPAPASRLHSWLRDTDALPAVLPTWGYGFWKSRDIYEHQSDAEEDYNGCRWHRIPLDAIVLDSPWETQYNTWIPNPHQFPDFEGMVKRFLRSGVRTVVWVVPWINTDSREGQIPPDPGSRALHSQPASNHEEGDRLGHYVRDGEESFSTQWWMGTGSPVDLSSEAAEQWWREQAKKVLRTGVAGIKTDDGEGYYFPDRVAFADGTTAAQTAWRMGLHYRRSMQRALDEVHGEGEGVIFGRCGWTGQQAVGVLWAGDQASDFWSLRVLVAATISAAHSGFSNWSHDVGGYLGARGLHRCPKELLIRWAQLGCFTPLMQAHGRLEQEPWTYDRETLKLYRGYVVLHEMLVPYVRAAAAEAARGGPPVIRPLPLIDPDDDRGWTLTDAFGYGPSLWVAPVLEDGAREREVLLPHGDWIETWSGARVTGGAEVVAPAPLHSIPVWVRDGSIVITYPVEHVSDGLGDTPDDQRPLEATLWGRPTKAVSASTADGAVIKWSPRNGWKLPPDRVVATREL